MPTAPSLADRLPPPAALERRFVALATLDALLSPDWEFRYYAFNRRWDEAQGTRMASMRDGSGDDLFALFYPDGSAILKGFAHESRALDGRPAITGVLDGVPDRFAGFLAEPAFDLTAATCCLWNAGDGWRRSATVAAAALAVDGSDQLLAHLLGTAADYARHVAEYFEAEVPPQVVARFFALEALTPELAAALHVEADLDAIPGDLDEIGYPVQR